MTLSKQEAFDRAVRLASRANDDFIELGKLLRQLKERDEALFERVRDKTGLSRRKAYYLVEIATRIEGLPIPRERLAKIGWTKAQIVGTRLTHGNWRQMLQLAEEHTAHGLKAILAGKRPDDRCIVLFFRPDDFERFKEAILKHGAKAKGAGFLNKEEALLKMIGLAERAAAW